MSKLDPRDTTLLVLDKRIGEAIVSTTASCGGDVGTAVFMPGLQGTCESTMLLGRDSMDVLLELFPGAISVQLVERGYDFSRLSELTEAVRSDTGTELLVLVAEARTYYPLPHGVPKLKDVWMRPQTARKQGRQRQAKGRVSKP